MSEVYGVIKGPCLTEKGDRLKEENGQIIFKVDPRANKIQIKEAVEKFFNVKVSEIRTARVRGKRKRVGRYTGQTSDWKKAIVSLKEGKIDFLAEL
jgi:large subunit ribosomal protein L23